MNVTYFKTFLHIYLPASALIKVVECKQTAQKIQVRQREFISTRFDSLFNKSEDSGQQLC